MRQMGDRTLQLPTPVPVSEGENYGAKQPGDRHDELGRCRAEQPFERGDHLRLIAASGFQTGLSLG